MNYILLIGIFIFITIIFLIISYFSKKRNLFMCYHDKSNHTSKSV